MFGRPPRYVVHSLSRSSVDVKQGGKLQYSQTKTVSSRDGVSEHKKTSIRYRWPHHIGNVP